MSFYQSDHYSSDYYSSNYYRAASGAVVTTRYVSIGTGYVTSESRYYSTGSTFVSLADSRLYYSTKSDDYETLP